MAKSWLGRDCALLCSFICAASIRSAGVPCRSPLVSFLNAYPTVIGLQDGMPESAQQDGGPQRLPQTQMSRDSSAQRPAGVEMPTATRSLGAYLLHRNWPFIASMEASDASKLS